MSYGGFGGQSSAPMPSASSPDDNALYGAPSATLILFTKFTAVFTILMMVLSFIFCLAMGKNDGADYLLATNVIISAIIGVTVGYWHRSGALAGDKLWFLLLVCVVIVFQCLTTDIYVFHDRGVAPLPPTTLNPVTQATLKPHMRSLPQ